MTDSVAVFPPGYRLTDSETGEPIIGATISFYDAGTTNPKPVYSDKDLQTALGTSVVTDSLGCPTSDGTTKVDVFVGTAPYKVTIADADDVVIETKDNRPGAVVSASSGSVSVTALFPVVTKSANYTVLQADQNTTFRGNCSSGDITFTLPSAVPGTGTGNVSAAGWKIKIQHCGSANHVIIKVATGSGQTISGGVASSAGQIVLVRQGEDVEISSDGGNWVASSHVTASPHGYATGVIQIVSRLATSPGSPAAGDKYILTGTGGSWASFATGDIATWNGATWSNQTPPSNCGWRAYVQAESRDYEYLSSAWVAQPLSTPAVQATMESQNAGTPVTADMQKFHPGHPKAWGLIDATGTILASFNIASVTRNSTGAYSVSLVNPMSSVNYAVPCSAISSPATATSNVRVAGAGNLSTGGFGLYVNDNDSSSSVDAFVHFVVLGDQ